MLEKMLILVLAMTSGLAAAAAGQPLVLVEQGVSRAPIVVAENASPATLRAAGELAGYIEKISAARPELLTSYYLMAQLAWNPRQDGAAVLDDYYRRGFGPAAADVQAYWELLERARRQVDERKATWREAFDGTLFEEARVLLQQGLTKLGADHQQHAARLDFVMAGLDFLRLQTENRELVSRLQATKNEDAAALDKARTNWERIEQIAGQYPLALNLNHVRRNVSGGPLKAVHPDLYGK